MLGVISNYIKDVSVLRRLMFAVAVLSPDSDLLWSIVVEFATAGEVSRETISSDIAKALMENIQTLNSRAFDSDEMLFKELTCLDHSGTQGVGVPLISKESKCKFCDSPLCIRKDRPSAVIIYNDSHGTIPALHFHQYCSNRSCSYTQYYGYYTHGNKEARYNSNWASLPYFISSKETGFSLKDYMLRFP